MSCGCKGGGSEEWRQYVPNPPVSAGLQLIAPRTNTDPPRYDTSRRVLETASAANTASLEGGVPLLWDVNAAVSSIGITGFLPWCARAFIAANGALSNLGQAKLRTLAASLQAYPLAGFSPPAGVQIDQFWIMGPGEVLDLGNTLFDGVEGFWFVPWAGLYPDYYGSAINVINSIRQHQVQQSSAAGGAPADGSSFIYSGSNLSHSNGTYYGASGDADLPTFGPFFAPVIRTSPQRAQMVSMPYTSTAWVLPNIPCNSGGPAPLFWACLPPGTRYVTVTFALPGGGGYKNGLYRGMPTRIASGASGYPVDVGVSWLDYQGLRVDHPADQLTATARGQISSSHQIEVYEIPRGATAISCWIQNSNGNMPVWSAISSPGS